MSSCSSACRVGLTGALPLVEGPVNRLAARAVAQTHPAAVLHRVGVDAKVTAHLLQNEYQMKAQNFKLLHHSYNPSDWIATRGEKNVECNVSI